MTITINFHQITEEINKVTQVLKVGERFTIIIIYTMITWILNEQCVGEWDLANIRNKMKSTPRSPEIKKNLLYQPVQI
jgi:hypothetical protein